MPQCQYKKLNAKDRDSTVPSYLCRTNVSSYWYWLLVVVVVSTVNRSILLRSIDSIYVMGARLLSNPNFGDHAQYGKGAPLSLSPLLSLAIELQLYFTNFLGGLFGKLDRGSSR